MSSQLRRAGQWLAHSGIQLPNGGVARYYRADVQRNAGVSTEITGYALSAFVFLHNTSADEEYLNRARAAARFLTGVAWDSQNRLMPFELEPAAYTYFFDCGIIVRGLLALWRVTREQELLDVAAAVGESMARDFARDDGQYWPILSLPDKRPLEMDALRWSRSAGCYQLKAAMAWRELADATGDARFAGWYQAALENALATHEAFLPGHTDPHKVMDRLHAYLYFLEGLLPGADNPRCAAALAQGIRQVSDYVEEIAPDFVRCDVLAQLLRVRLCAGEAGADAAETGCVRAFQEPGGGYYFGRKAGECVPHISPVSTVFAMQALEWWERRDAIDWRAII
ncbi:MAG: hypothetical protein ABSG03_41120 [Bryobacteraceae bacterium]